MASLKEKIEKALVSPASGIVDPIVDIEETSTNKVAGFIISNTFLDMDQLDRQNKVSNYIERVFQQEEALRIVSLVTVTPDEADLDVA